MTLNYGLGGVPDPPPSSVVRPQPVLYGRDDYAPGSCPECGGELISKAYAAKHSISHYGDVDLPSQGHLNLVARQRQAYLNDRQIPER